MESGAKERAAYVLEHDWKLSRVRAHPLDQGVNGCAETAA
jgi:hypothetical protein